MSAPQPLEISLLFHAESQVSRFAARFGKQPHEARLQALEAAAARLGGFDLEAFHRAFGVKPIAPAKDLMAAAEMIVGAIERTPIHPALALSALSREPLKESDRKSTGAYHTDFRLATRLAEIPKPLRGGMKVIDPASGAGILLIALTIAACGRDRKKTAEWLSQSVYAADLSSQSLRGALLALASLTDDLPALVEMRSKWLCMDSLMASDEAWKSMAPEGFDVVIGNPPWEKVKITKHEFLKATGAKRHYGSEIEGLDHKAFAKERGGVASYAKGLVEKYPALASGEPDLYVAFVELASRLCKPGGHIALLVPGGLIRSQGTETIRKALFESSESVAISVIDNKARFFGIDTRFKFLALGCRKAEKGNPKRNPIRLLHEKGAADGLGIVGAARIGRESLKRIRPDMSIPEVRNDNEWRMFRKMAGNGTDWGADGNGWRPEFCREVDMTRDRGHFKEASSAGIPLVEGRMVQQHRFGAKCHVSGSGRRAVWETCPIGKSRLSPQFWIEESALSPKAKARSGLVRAGFCDIAGQTNERSMMAAIIPPGSICGNKVPTVLFPDDPGEERLLVWAAVMNSLPFDWMLRRVLTTTVNYFVLLGLPLPRIAKDGLPWKRLAKAARALRDLDAPGSGIDVSMAGRLRAEIDVDVAIAYGLDFNDIEAMLQDFPLLDRAQPALPGEARSTITRDTLLCSAALRMGGDAERWKARVEMGRKLKASPYIPSETASDEQEEEQKGEANVG